MLLRFTAVAFLILLSACSTLPSKQLNAQRELYCDRYLVYRMCAHDISGNGAVDAIYFEDSRQVFLYRASVEPLVVSHYEMHRCAQLMDDGLSESSDRLLTINDETPFLKRAELKSGLITHYLRYIPRVNSCNSQKQSDTAVAQSEVDEEFDNFAYDDYDY